MFRLCAVVISIMVYTVAFALAPSGDSLNNQFLRPTVNGRIAFSLSYLYIKNKPLSSQSVDSVSVKRTG